MLVLMVGFSFLGFLSLINQAFASAATGLFAEAIYSIIGGCLSILVGATFLAVFVLSGAGRS